MTHANKLDEFFQITAKRIARETRDNGKFPKACELTAGWVFSDNEEDHYAALEDAQCFWNGNNWISPDDDNARDAETERIRTQLQQLARRNA